MNYSNPHQQQLMQMNLLNQQQQQQLMLQQQQSNQLQQQLMQQQLMGQNMAAGTRQHNPMQQQAISTALQCNPQMAMMVQQNPSLLSNPAFIQQLLCSVPQSTGQNQNLAALQQGMFQQQTTYPQLQPDTYSGRFGGVGQTQTQTPQQQQQQEQKQTYPSTTKSESVQSESQVSKCIPEFKVNTSPVSIFNNTKFTITPKVTKFNPETIDDQGVILVNALSTGLETIIEQVSASAKNCILSVLELNIHDTSTLVPFSENLNKLLQGDVRHLYKTLRLVYNEIKTVDDLIIAEKINQYLTDLVNHYLKINLDNSVDITSFVEDFNDLLKALRSNFEDTEDDLRDYIQEEVEEIKNLYNNRLEENKKDFYLVEGVTLTYYADHHVALGLKDVGDTVEIIADPSNQFLLGMAKYFFTDRQRTKFYLYTYDKKLFVFSTNKKEQVFVELVISN